MLAALIVSLLPFALILAVLIWAFWHPRRGR